MPHYLVKLAEDEYVEWSTIVDAPVTYICTRAEAIAEWGEDRVERTDRNGTSHHLALYHAATPEDAILPNRAGPGETELSLADLRAEYAHSENHGPADPPA